MSGTAVTIGELIGAGTSAYSAFLDNRNTTADDAAFHTTMVSVASALMGIFSKPEARPYLNGLSAGVGAGSNAALIGFGINALSEAKTPAEGLSATLNIIGGVSGIIANFAPPGPAKLLFSSISMAAGVAELAVKSNASNVNSLINDLTAQWHSARHYLSDLGLSFGSTTSLTPDSATTALSATVAVRRDPLVLDLDGDGIETTSTREGTVVLFDHDADGVKTGTGWVKPDDGWLVMDRNGNGTIDSGRELFGVDTLKKNGTLAADGFDALKDLDANADGKISATDAVFSKLRVWRDLNQDGVSQANELSTLSANNIVSIGVNASAVRTELGNGNLQTAAGTFTRSNGSTGNTGETTDSNAANLDLLVDTFYREFTTSITLTDQAKALPNMKGSGQVRDLSEAISLSSTLGNTVQTYSTQTTRDGQINRLDALIEQWANTSSMKSLKDQAEALAGSANDWIYGCSADDVLIYKLG